MKTKRIISIVMVVVMMLSVVFCVVPTASASTTPKVTYTASIDGIKMSNSYKLYQANTYFVNYNFAIDGKSIDFFDLIDSRKIESSNKNSIPNEYGYNLTIDGGDKKKVKVTCSVLFTKNKKRIEKFINDKLWNGKYSLNQIKVIQKYIKSKVGKKVSYSFIVYPQPFKAKTDHTTYKNGEAYVYVKPQTSHSIGYGHYTIVGSSKVILVETYSTGMLRFRVTVPKSKSTYKISIVSYTYDSRRNKEIEHIHKTYKIKPYQFVKPGYVLK